MTNKRITYDVWCKWRNEPRRRYHTAIPTVKEAGQWAVAERKALGPNWVVTVEPHEDGEATQETTEQEVCKQEQT